MILYSMPTVYDETDAVGNWTFYLEQTSATSFNANWERLFEIQGQKCQCIQITETV